MGKEKEGKGTRYMFWHLRVGLNKLSCDAQVRECVVYSVDCLMHFLAGIRTALLVVPLGGLAGVASPVRGFLSVAAELGGCRWSEILQIKIMET